MDPIAHTFTGAALAAAGLRRATPLATAALLIAANIPDVDIVATLGDEHASLAHRRGWTHGLLALAIWPFVVTGLLLAYDLLRRRSTRGDPPIAALALLGVAAVGVVSHPLLDWLNNYGMRWLMPFDGRWFYGDALFIIDPWVWLALGGVVCAAYSRPTWAAVGWSTFWLLGTVLLFTTPLVPTVAKVLWLVGLAAIAAARARGFGAPGRERAIEGAARIALGAVVVYAGVLLAANLPARAEVRAILESRGVGPVGRVMVAPEAANPFVGWVVAETADAYHVGSWNWLAETRFVPDDEPIARIGDSPIAAAAAKAPAARRYLVWARFPYVEIESTLDQHTVSFYDARYSNLGRLFGPTIRLDRRLEPVSSAD
jgi:inner membrane protein